MRFDNMVLYIKPGCPFCSKVMLFMEENGIEMKILDSTEPENSQALLDMNGHDAGALPRGRRQADARVR